MSTFVTHRQYNAHLRSIFKKNIANHGKSLTAASMDNCTKGVILEIQTDRRGMLVIDDWRKELNRQHLVPAQTTQE